MRSGKRTIVNWRRVRFALGLVLLSWILTGSAVSLSDPVERVRRFTRDLEFDFVGWTVEALAVKSGQSALGAASYLAEPDRRDLVVEYAGLVDRAAQLDRRLLELLADPAQPAPEADVVSVRAELSSVRARQSAIQTLVEPVLQEQVGEVLGEWGLAVGGAPIPPVSFRFSQLPLALIVSPRDVIRQDANLQLHAGLELEEQVGLESEVERGLGVSALVVPVGGIGTYPTMVQESGSVGWLAEVVAHEWVHNYLTLRPLGWSYEASPEARTMNETAASLLGAAIGRRVLERHYPWLVPPPEAEPSPPAPGEPPAFDFEAEMHRTRVQVDALLAEGRVEEAEAYMEERRRLFWEQGYRIRRLNQAYFAFHGAYADQPEGAAGQDPVGEAVRQLWSMSPSPAVFLRRMAWITSFSDLQGLVEELATTR